MTTPDVVIPVYNEERDLQRCVDILATAMADLRGIARLRRTRPVPPATELGRVPA